MFKKYLNKDFFINLVDNKKIWNKELTPNETLDLLNLLEKTFNKHKFKKDKNFIMTERRLVLKNMINERLESSTKHNDNIKESLFNLWEFIRDEYTGNLFTISEKLNIDIKKLENMAEKYKKKNIICLEEKEQILDIIIKIKNYIKK